VKIFREEVQVRASIHTLGGFSAHADKNALEAWIRGVSPAPQQVFLIHGEESVSEALAGRLRELLSVPVAVPSPGEEIYLGRPGEEAPQAMAPDEERVLGQNARDLSRRLQGLSDLLGGQTWEDPVLRHQMLKQMRKIARLTDKLEKMSTAGG
jgi:hypothetical protein